MTAAVVGDFVAAIVRQFGILAGAVERFALQERERQESLDVKLIGIACLQTVYATHHAPPVVVGARQCHLAVEADIGGEVLSAGGEERSQFGRVPAGGEEGGAA